MRIMGVWLALCCLAATAQALELVVNGGFEQPVATGWQQETVGSAWYIDRGTSYDPDPDYEVLVRHSTGTGMALLSQEVVIPSTDVQFSIRAKIQATATSSAWAGAAVTLSYLDQHGFLLGETYISVGSQHCPWSNSPTLHLISAPFNAWMTHAFTLADELVNLPDIDPAAVHTVKVGLLVRAADC